MDQTNNNNSSDGMMEAMERLARIMNDSPSVVKLSETEFAIKALRPGTQWLIAEEACKIVRNENMTMGDIIKQFSVNVPSIVKVLTLAILNDKDRIFADYKAQKFSDEYEAMYDTIMWQTKPNDWIPLLSEVLQMINIDFFLASTNAVMMIREMTLAKKMTMEEARSLRAEQNGDK